MKTWIAMLRGINVSGQKIIKMADLRVLLTKAGLLDVETYIQSGNIIFSAEELKLDKLENKIAKAIKNEYTFDVSVMVRDADLFEAVLNNNPFLKDDNEKQLYVTFLESAPEASKMENINREQFAPEEFALKDSWIYLHYPNGAGKAKLSNNVIEQKLKLAATSRNWRTVTTLYTMAKNR